MFHITSSSLKDCISVTDVLTYDIATDVMTRGAVCDSFIETFKKLVTLKPPQEVLYSKSQKSRSEHTLVCAFQCTEDCLNESMTCD